MQLRPYQQDVYDEIHRAWVYNPNVCAVMPTGAGKTVLFARTIHDHVGYACVIAHRQELVSQISMALAREGVEHTIVGPVAVVKYIVNLQVQELGRSFYNVNAKVAVAGVDTLIRRHEKLKVFCAKVTLWVIDEGHHVLRENKWGKACEMFPNAKGLLVTATPCRSDGKGLGRHAEGVIDTLVEGPTMRWLIDNGYLTDYRIFAPPTEDLVLDNVPISPTTGDFNPIKLKVAVQQSHLVGDVVKHYLQIACGKRGVTFTTDVETAEEIAKQYRDCGVPALAVSAKSTDRERQQAVNDLREGRVLNLVNCDLFGEGFDLPAIEVVSMARPTQSYGLFCQQFGRALRPLEGKTHAIIIDHCSNVIRHGLPDKERDWSLESREKRPRMKNPDDEIPLRYCIGCTQPYSKLLKICPYCDTPHIPAGKSKPEQVDGDLTELSPEFLDAMRKEISRVDESPERTGERMRIAGAPEAAWRSAIKNCRQRQDNQGVLRHTISWWAAWQRDHEGLNDSQIYRKFYLQYGIDILSAQALGSPEAKELSTKINEALERYHGSSRSSTGPTRTAHSAGAIPPGTQPAT